MLSSMRITRLLDSLKPAPTRARCPRCKSAETTPLYCVAVSVPLWAMRCEACGAEFYADLSRGKRS